MIPSAMQPAPATLHRNLLTAFVALTISLCPLFAADGSKQSTDPFAGAFFPPELVLLAQDQIALTPEQLDTVRASLKRTQAQTDELRVKLERETAALSALTKLERVDEAAIIAQLDKVLDLEREVKHLHVGEGVTIKNLLTPEQQARLREISLEMAKDHATFTRLQQETGKRISAKIQRVKESTQKWMASGRDPSAIARSLEETLKPLMTSGKVFEAEAELDRVLEQLAKDTK